MQKFFGMNHPSPLRLGAAWGKGVNDKQSGRAYGKLTFCIPKGHGIIDRQEKGDVMDIKDFENLDEKSLLKELMKRSPSLYVGAPRLDYLQHFAGGFMMSSWHNKAHPNNEFTLTNYEMQRWLLTDQSTIIRHNASLNGWSLFYRCFGCRQLALSNFARYLHSDIPKFRDDTMDDLILGAPCVARDVANLQRSLEKPDISKYGPMVISLIKEMIHGECDTFNLIKICVTRDRLFCQIRFIYHTQAGWRDDATIIANPGNYENLLKLHAYVECMEDGELSQLFKIDDYYCTFDNQQRFKYIDDRQDDIKDDAAFYTQYALWKTGETTWF